MSSDESAYRIAPSLRCGTALSVLFLALLGSVSTRAQDVAEAARQERARKAAQANQPHHVYTEEDLKKAQILTPYDVSRALESRKTAAPQREPEPKLQTRRSRWRSSRNTRLLRWAKWRDVIGRRKRRGKRNKPRKPRLHLAIRSICQRLRWQRQRRRSVR